MKRIIFEHGALLLMDVTALYLAMLVLLADAAHVLPTVLFIIPINVVYFMLDYHYADGGKQ